MSSRFTKFMRNKPFHPANYENRKRVWEAEQRALTEEKRLTARENQLKKEKKNAETAKELAQKDGKPSTEQLKRAQLGFMYDVPKTDQGSSSNNRDKKNQTKQEEREGKFAILKNAPREGTYTDNMDLNFKPFGQILKNVKCLRCQQWGHTVTERECPLYQDHSKLEEERKLREDPLLDMQNNYGDALEQVLEEQHDIAWMEGLDKSDKKRLLRAFKHLDKKEYTLPKKHKAKQPEKRRKC